MASLFVASFVVVVLVALVAVELSRPRLFAVAKPLATLLLLPIVGVPPSGPVRALVACGVLLSVAGDLALIGSGSGAFMAGLVLFLGAHVVYSIVFVMAELPATAHVVGGLVFGVASLWLLRALWPRLTPGLRVPVVVYAGAITVMATLALATLTGGWSLRASVAAAVGATLFYLSDATLAWNQFRQPLPHGQTLTLSLYWAGQLGIALAARWAE